jgi:hypothetical protein
LACALFGGRKHSLISGSEPRLVPDGVLQWNRLRCRRTRDLRSRLGHRPCSSHPYHHHKTRHRSGTFQFPAQGIKRRRDACLHTADRKRHEVDMPVCAASLVGLCPRTIKPRAPPPPSNIRDPRSILFRTLPFRKPCPHSNSELAHEP